MKAKSSQTLSVVLAIQCGVWMAFAPVLSQMHQAVADHHHVFCAEHNRIEDEGLPSNGPSALSEALDVRFENGIGVRICSPASGGAGSECVFSNFSVHAQGKTDVQMSGRHLPNCCALASLHDVNFRIANTLDVAPKNSPPGVS